MIDNHLKRGICVYDFFGPVTLCERKWAWQQFGATMIIDNDSYTADELGVLNLLKHPVWVFDIEGKRMFWANRSALEVWNSESLEALLARDFASDMSEAAELRMKDNLATLSRGGTLHEQWTLYPKGIATTLSLTASAIRIDGGRIAALCETELPEKEAFQEDTVRGLEILRHLPFAVAQYTIEGELIYQNAEALSTFGVANDAAAASTGESTTDAAPSSDGDLLSRFVDKSLGKTALRKVQEGHDFNAETQYVTSNGPRWFSTALRRTRDPVTSKYVILHSARDISEIVKARKETTRAAMKSEFMSIMAHEIRTPLHQMVGYLDLLALTPLSHDQRESFDEVQNSTSMLMSIINDLLDYSKLECGQMHVEMVNFALDGVVQGCLSAVKPEADRKMLALHSELPDCAALPSKLAGDPNRLRQILLNLLSNAVKFTERGSITVTITVVEANESNRRLRFEVVDTGIGIKESEQKLLFEKYTQANSSVARTFGGTGLGLAICKGLTDLMGGCIGLESAVGKGSTFFFEISFELATKQRCHSDVDLQSLAMVSDLNVLVVEDNRVNQKVMRSMLERLGHTVTLAENGMVALDEVRRKSFDVVLMDVQMPVMDGIECTKQIRLELGIDKTTLPIVGLTASFQNSDLEYYLNIGMTGCLGKPLRMDQLQLALSNAVSVRPTDPDGSCEPNTSVELKVAV
jgi:signal transduction histidine kinase/ActR/RegA family two-component response regulator